MDAFATAQQMADRSQGAIPVIHPHLGVALKAASRRIRNYCGWHISGVESTTFRLRRGTPEGLWLPSLQIVSIDVVTSYGEVVDLDTTPVEFDPDTGWTNIVAGNVVVEFTHGFADHPEDVVDLTLQMAARALGSPLGYTREQAGARQVNNSLTAAGVSGGVVLMEHEKPALAAYKIVGTP